MTNHRQTKRSAVSLRLLKRFMMHITRYPVDRPNANDTLKRLESVMNSTARHGVFIVQVRPHHSAPSSAALTESFGTDYSVQARRTGLQILPWNGTEVYLVDEHFQPANLGIRFHVWSASSLPVSRTQLSTSGDQAFPDRCCSFCRFTSSSHHLWQLSTATWRPSSSGVHSLDFCSASEVILSLLDTFIDHVIYSLTYLLELIRIWSNQQRDHATYHIIYRTQSTFCCNFVLILYRSRDTVS